ncbi:hypothetical protein [Acinetobacter brisouii]|uniref:hypothetical protein n=1 Tax=Acinetobacter brisouii TaxID=396323 RepID=UPI00124E71F0|nr:hypothetical protein [Acinetobacter brisouii]
MAKNKASPFDGILLIFAAIVAFVSWLFENIGKTLIGLLVIGGVWGCILVYKKRKQKLNKAKHPVIYVGQAKSNHVQPQKIEIIEPYSDADYSRDSKIFYKQFVSECWETLNTPSPHPDVARANGLYFMQHPLNERHSEIIRALQIIRESIDIVMQSTKEKTIAGRMDVIAQCYETLQVLQYLFSDSRDYDQIHERLAELIQPIHTTVYLNIAQGHINKMESVKTDKTKTKYLGLAVEALELGLNDADSDQKILQDQIAKLKTHELYNSVQNKT